LVTDYTGGESDYLGGSGVFGIDPIYGLDKSNFLGTSVEVVMVTSFRTLPENWYTQDHVRTYTDGRLQLFVGLCGTPSKFGIEAKK